MPRSILTISVFTFITVIVWTFVEVWGATHEIQVSNDLQNNISQKNYTFISDKKSLTDNMLKNSTIKYTRSQLDGQQ
jgi:hypothetical protein